VSYVALLTLLVRCVVEQVELLPHFDRIFAALESLTPTVS